MCSITPRFSYRCPKTRVRAVPGCTREVAQLGTAGSWVGWAGVVPTQHAARGGPTMRNVHPGAACCGCTGGIVGPGVPGTAAGTGYGTHPPGPVGHPWCPPWYHTPRNAASWPIKARIQVIFLKVSQNGGVSPKSVHKACHSPCIQNGLRKSPLDIPRFSISASLLSQGINGPFLAGSGTLVSK